MKEQTFDMICAGLGLALAAVTENKKKFFDTNKSVRYFAIATTAFVVARGVYDIYKKGSKDVE